MIDIREQPIDILKGDYVIIIHEEKKYKEIIGSTFVVGEIITNQNKRNYQLLFFNGNPVRFDVNEKGEQYWAKREFIEVAQRHNENGEVEFYKVNCIPDKKDNHLEVVEFGFDSFVSIIKKIIQ